MPIGIKNLPKLVKDFGKYEINPPKRPEDFEFSPKWQKFAQSGHTLSPQMTSSINASYEKPNSEADDDDNISTQNRREGKRKNVIVRCFPRTSICVERQKMELTKA